MKKVAYLAFKLLFLKSIKTPENKDKIIAEQAARIHVLEQKVDALLKILYGVKSEKIDPAQLQLLLEGLDPKKHPRAFHPKPPPAQKHPHWRRATQNP